MGAFGCISHALVRDEGSVLNYLPSIVSLGFFRIKKRKYPLDFIKLCKALPKKITFQISYVIFYFLLDQIYLEELCRDSTYGQNLQFHPDYTLDLYIHRCLNEKTLENLYVWMFFQVIGARQAIQATFLVSVDNQNFKESTSL